MSVKLHSAGASHARSLIKAGKVNSGSWSFSGEDGDKLLGPDKDDWAAYSKWFLGEDESAEENTKARWKYPFGKGGSVYTAALKAAEGRATQQDASAISECAGKLLVDARPDDKEGSDKGDEGERLIDTANEPSIVKDEDKRSGRRSSPGAPPVMPSLEGIDEDDGERDMDDDGGDGDEDDDSDDERSMKLCRGACAHAKKMIAAGKVDHGPFTFDAADRAAMLGPKGTHHSELQRHHLGTDKSQDDDAKKPAYPFAKEGRCYSRAFRSIARRAAADGHDDICAAANKLMELAKPPDDDGKDEPMKPAKKGRSGGRPSGNRPGRYEYRTLEFRVTEKTAPDGSYFEGYAAVVNNIDEYGTIMGAGCFDADLATFKRDGFFGGLNHNWDEPIGKPDVVRLDSRGLFVGGNVLDTAHALDCRKWLAAGVINKLSFGFDVLEQKWLEEPEDVEAYWRSVGYKPTAEDKDRSRRGALLFKRLKVFEASPVMVPGNSMADITAVRSDDDSDVSSPHLTLDSHGLAAHDTAGSYCDRMEQLAGLRASQGRSLAKDKLASLARLHDRLGIALAACQPRAPKADVVALKRELLTMSAKVYRPA